MIFAVIILKGWAFFSWFNEFICILVAFFLFIKHWFCLCRLYQGRLVVSLKNVIVFMQNTCKQVLNTKTNTSVQLKIIIILLYTYIKACSDENYKTYRTGFFISLIRCVFVNRDVTTQWRMTSWSYSLRLCYVCCIQSTVLFI